MEAMIYLANENKLVINDSIRTKMELLKSERSTITVESCPPDLKINISFSLFASLRVNQKVN